MWWVGWWVGGGGGGGDPLLSQKVESKIYQKLGGVSVAQFLCAPIFWI